VELEFHTRLEKARVEPADFEEFRRYQDAVSDEYYVYVRLRPVERLTDATALEELLKLDPGNVGAVLALARLYRDRDRLADARQVLQAAMARAPKEDRLAELFIEVASKVEKQAAGERGRAHYQLAQNYLEHGDAARALEQLEKAGQAAPSLLRTAEALKLKGRIHDRLDQREPALQAYRQAVQLVPNDRGSLSALVVLSVAAGNRTEAMDWLRRYTLAAGSDADALAAAAEFHLRLDRPADALELAARVKPATVRSDTVLGLVYLQRGDYEDAVRHLGAAVKAIPAKQPLDGQVLDALLRASLASGDRPGAEAWTKSLERVAAPSQELRLLCVAVNGMSLRVKALAKGMPAAPEKAEAVARALDCLVCAEHAYGESKSTALVESLLAGAFANGVECGAAFALRAQLALERGRLTDALRDAERALALSPAETRGYLVRGRVRLERGAAGALADLEKAAELSQRQDAAVLHWLARALFQAGKFKEALAAQREAVRLSPGHGEYAEQLRTFEKQSVSP
jgi:tetratricopeptide (TPR) repeat protein